MYRERIQSTQTSSIAAARLKEAMLSYNDFQRKPQLAPSEKQLTLLSEWQSARLIHTHKALYQSPDYSEGLHFLFSELYSSKDFSRRDNDLERIFPKIVKYLPTKVIHIVSLLVELNHLTQQLDQQLALVIFHQMKLKHIDEELYCNAYHSCNNETERLRQIQLTQELGSKLDRYARSSTLLFTLKMTEGAAEMKGLSALHQFLKSGFDSFHKMKSVDSLMHEISTKERNLMHSIFHNKASPFNFDMKIQTIQANG